MIPAFKRCHVLSLVVCVASGAFLSNHRFHLNTQRSRRHFPGLLQESKQTEDLNGILANMGLTPVTNKKIKVTKQPVPKPPTKKKQKSAQSTKPTRKSKRIDLKTQLDYARNGHAGLKHFVDPSQLKQIRKQVLKLADKEELKAWRQKVQVASDSKDLAASCQSVQECQERLEELGITASLPFLQYFNTWRRIPAIQDLAYELGEAAAVLLDVPKIRLYQDSLFWKRRGDGPTPWHVDARMAPFDTSHMITFWIPLEAIPTDGTGLLFCSKSHADVALPYWNPIDSASKEWDRLEDRYPKRIMDYMPMQMGDVTVHSGWTLHSSNGNEHDSDRVALAISFVDAKAEVREDALGGNDSIGDNEDQWSYQDWVHQVPPRKPFEHDLVPIVWPPKDA